MPDQEPAPPVGGDDVRLPLSSLSDEELAAAHEEAIEQASRLTGDAADDTAPSEESVSQLESAADRLMGIQIELDGRENLAKHLSDRARDAAQNLKRLLVVAQAPGDSPAGDDSSAEDDSSAGGEEEDETAAAAIAPSGDAGEEGDADVTASADSAASSQDQPASGQVEAAAPSEEGSDISDDSNVDPAESAEGATQEVTKESNEDLVAAATGTETEQRKTSVSKALSGLSADAAKSVPRSKVGIVTAADVPGFATGSDLNFDDLVAAATARIKRMPSKPSGNAANPSRMSFGVAAVSRGGWGDLTDANPEFASNSSKLLDRAGNVGRLEEDLMAAGWCAPSQPLYDLCEQETLDGILDIAEMQITRGGIRLTPGPDFADIFTAGAFAQTEAEAEAGTQKPCFEIECPDFTEVRLDAVGVCLLAGILTNAAYPELIERWIRGGMTAHQHAISGRVISDIAGLIGAPLAFPGTNGVAASVLGAVEVSIRSQRSARRLSRDAPMEVLAPEWLLGAIRADLSYRNGVDYMSVSDQVVERWFAERGARVQWLYNYQDLGTDCADGYPETVELIVFPAGTFVKGVADVIQLEAVYDSAGMAVNTYTGLFFEEGVLTARRCHGGCRITVPVCVSGQTGAADLDTCTLVGTNIST